MWKALVLFLLFWMPLNSFAETVDCKDLRVIYRPGSNTHTFNDKLFTGKCESYYQNGQKKRETNYIDGERHGTWTEWYENGQKSKEQNWKDGEFHGTQTGWYENGQKKWKTIKPGFENGNGTFINFSPDEKETSQMIYKQGEPWNGTSTHWYENGQKEQEFKFKDGERHGTWTEWYENGQKSAEVNYIDGKKHGTHTTWYENGIKEWEINFKDGIHKSRKVWDENGNLTIDKTF